LLIVFKFSKHIADRAFETPALSHSMREAKLRKWDSEKSSCWLRPSVCVGGQFCCCCQGPIKVMWSPWLKL